MKSGHGGVQGSGVEPVRIGVSSCLLGERVRYDGADKHDPLLVGMLGSFFAFVSVCPEVGCGMTTPREAMRLEGDPDRPRLVAIESRSDRTETMLAYCRSKVVELEAAELCGFVFKKNSPSCGLCGVMVHRDGIAVAGGSGLFAARVVAHFPELPVEEAESLNRPDLMEHFVARVFRYRSRQDSPTEKPAPGARSALHS